MNRTSTYLRILSEEITDDLRNHIDTDKLQDEVEKELKKQVLSGLVDAINKYNHSLLYGYDKRNEEINATAVLRHMDYVKELFSKSDEIKGVLPSGSIN